MTVIRVEGVEGSRGAWVALAVFREGADWRLNVAVRYHAFQGESDTWVTDRQWRAFVEGVEGLERTRQGSARLVSMSPGELMLGLGARDSLGHMAVHGEIGLTGAHTASLRFGEIAFDPGVLSSLAGQLRGTVLG